MTVYVSVGPVLNRRSKMKNRFVLLVIFFTLFGVYGPLTFANGCKASARNWWILLDNSGSMGTNLTPGMTRRDHAQRGLDQFIDRVAARSSSQMGLIASDADSVIVPLTSSIYTVKDKIRGNWGGGNPYTSLDRFANNILTQGSCTRAVLVTDGTDGANPMAAAAEIARKCSCLFIVGVGFSQDQRPYLQQVAEAGNGTFCNGNNSYELESCLTQSLKPYKYNPSTKVCEDSSGQKGLNEFDISDPPRDNDFTCYNFSNVDFTQNNWNDLFILSRSFSGSSFSNSNFTGLSIKGVGMASCNFDGANLSNARFEAIIEDSSFKATQFASTQIYVGVNNVFSDIEGGALTLDIHENTSYNNQFINVRDLSLKLNPYYSNHSTVNDYIFRNFSGSLNIANVDFERAQFYSCSFSDLNLQHVSFSNFFFKDLEAKAHNCSELKFNSGTIEGNFSFKANQINGLSFSQVQAQNINIEANVLSNSTVQKSEFQALKLKSAFLTLEVSDNSKIDNAAISSSAANLKLANSSCQACKFDNDIFLDLKIVESNVRDSSFRGAEFRHSEFTQAMLAGANFENSNFIHASFLDSNLSSATLTPLTGTRNISFKKVILDQAKMNNFWFGADDLEDVSFKAADLSNARIPESAHLKKISFEQADLGGVNISGLSMQDVSFKAAKNFPNGNLSLLGVDCSKCVFSDLVFPIRIESGTITESIFDNAKIFFPSFHGVIQNSSFHNATIGAQTKFGGAQEMEVRSNDFRKAIFEKGVSFENVRFFKNRFNDAKLISSTFDHASFSDDDLENVNFQDSSFSETSFNRVNLQGGSFKQTRLVETNFSNLQLGGTYWHGANLFNVTFEHVDFVSEFGQPYGLSKITGPLGRAFGLNIVNSDMSEVLLPNLVLTNSKFSNVKLENSDLSNSIFSHVELTNVGLDAANLQYSHWENVKASMVRFNQANISNGHFSECQIEGSDLRKVEGLESAQFYSNTGLASFKATNLSDLDFSGHNLMKINFSHAVLDYTNFEDANLYNCNFDYAMFDNTNFDKAKVCGSTFIMANTWDALGLDLCP